MVDEVGNSAWARMATGNNVCLPFCEELQIIFWERDFSLVQNFSRCLNVFFFMLLFVVSLVFDMAV